MPASTAQADLISNKTALLLSKSQRLIQSWLPPPSSTSNDPKSEEELKKEDQALFVAEPEVLGVGAKVPKDGEVSREDPGANEKLRRQLLGKDWDKRGTRKNVADVAGKPQNGGNVKIHFQRKREAVEESEDEGGRSSLGKRKHKPQVEKSDDTGDASILDGQDDSSSRSTARPTLPTSKTASYLDEVLAERSERKRKKSKKKRKQRNVESSES